MKYVFLGVNDAMRKDASYCWRVLRRFWPHLLSALLVFVMGGASLFLAHHFPAHIDGIAYYDVAAVIAIAMVSAYVAVVIVIDTNIVAVLGLGLLLLFLSLWAIYQRVLGGFYDWAFLQSNIALWAVRITLYLGLSFVGGGATHRFLVSGKDGGRMVVRVIVLVIVLTGLYALLLYLNGGETP